MAVAAARPTTQKTRIVAHNQQVVRADREVTGELDARTKARLVKSLRALDGAIDGAIVSDYSKGLVRAPIVQALTGHARRCVITGDPKPDNIAAFAGVDCIAPNAAEAASAAGMPLLTRRGSVARREPAARARALPLRAHHAR